MKRIYLGGEKAKGKYVLVDDDSYYKLMEMDLSISPGAQDYPSLTLGYKGERLHRFIIGLDNIPPGKDVDHIDGNIYNAMRSNLRICTKLQNNYNRGKPKLKKKERTSEFLGVTKEDGKYRSHFRFTGEDGKRYHRSKSFKNEIDAAIHHNREMIREAGEYARINTVPVPGTIGVKEFEQLLEKRLKGDNKNENRK